MYLYFCVGINLYNNITLPYLNYKDKMIEGKGGGVKNTNVSIQVQSIRYQTQS